MTKVEFALIYPSVGHYVDWPFAKDIAVEAEVEGFSTFLIWDHYMLPESPRTFEAWLLLSAISSLTSTIRLGTCVTPLPFRHPAQLAKMVATLDYLSNGRVLLGVGAGWHKPEFDGYSEWRPAGERVLMVEEDMRIIRKLWSKGRIGEFNGRYYTIRNTVLDPRPIQKPGPPVLFGTTGIRMSRLAARYGDGWIPTLISHNKYRLGWSRITSMASAYGRDPGRFLPAFQIYTPFQTRSEALNFIQGFVDSGCRLCGLVWRYPKEEALERITWFRKEVMESF